MHRRSFLGSIVSLPVVSVPLLPSLAGGEKKEEEHWEISSAWFGEETGGELVLVKDGEVAEHWEYSNHTEWQKVTLLNAHWVAEDTEYVVDPFGLDVKDLYLDPPYFRSRFEGEYTEVQIQRGKDSKYDYTYHLQTRDEDGLHGVEGGSDCIEELVKKVSGQIN